MQAEAAPQLRAPVCPRCFGPLVERARRAVVSCIPCTDDLAAYLQARGYSVRTPEAMAAHGRKAGVLGAAAWRANRTEEERLAHLTMMRNARTKKLKDGRPPHGTPERYWRKTTLCRCEACRRAYLVYLHAHPTAQMRARALARAEMELVALTCKGCGEEFQLHGDPRRGYCTEPCRRKAAWARRTAKLAAVGAL